MINPLPVPETSPLDGRTLKHVAALLRPFLPFTKKSGIPDPLVVIEATTLRYTGPLPDRSREQWSVVVDHPALADLPDGVYAWKALDAAMKTGAATWRRGDRGFFYGSMFIPAATSDPPATPTVPPLRCVADLPARAWRWLADATNPADILHPLCTYIACGADGFYACDGVIMHHVDPVGASPLAATDEQPPVALNPWPFPPHGQIAVFVGSGASRCEWADRPADPVVTVTAPLEACRFPNFRSIYPGADAIRSTRPLDQARIIQESATLARLNRQTPLRFDPCRGRLYSDDYDTVWEGIPWVPDAPCTIPTEYDPALWARTWRNWPESESQWMVTDDPRTPLIVQGPRAWALVMALRRVG